MYNPNLSYDNPFHSELQTHCQQVIFNIVQRYSAILSYTSTRNWSVLNLHQASSSDEFVTFGDFRVLVQTL